MKASPEAQQRLLELADLDAELSRLDHRRRTLPEIAEADRIRPGTASCTTRSSPWTPRRKISAREQAKAEADVDQVRTRVERDRKRLDGGQVSSARELENLQSEIVSLARRQSDLEEIVLDVMERRETRAEPPGRPRRRAGRAGRAAGGGRRPAGRRAGRDRRGGGQGPGPAGGGRRGGARRPAGLYEKLRAQHGVGAAALRGGRCQGCHLSLNTVDLNRIRAADPDEVLRCEECRRILVRTPESGL